jgi:hypothetical protein
MGKRAVDLPDPLEQPGQSPAQADDLISELAGEAIERLISSGENEKAGDRRGNPDTKPEQSTAAPKDTETAWGRADLAAQPVANEHTDVGAQLDQLFKTLTPLGKIEDKEPPPVQASAQDSTPLLSKVRTSAEDDEELLEYVNARLGARRAVPSNGGVAHTEPKGANGKPTVEEHAVVHVRTLVRAVPKTVEVPRWIRFLEAINAPFAGLSDRRRAALGKAAIVTLVNALAVLMYVLLFR